MDFLLLAPDRSRIVIEVDGETIYGCFGPYVVDGRFAGLYNRFARDGFIAYNALVGAVVPS